MVLYTIIPPEELFADDAEPVPPVKAAVGGVAALVTPLGDGTARIERLLSTDPDDYLNPALQPGLIVALSPINPTG